VSVVHRAFEKNRWKLLMCFVPTAHAARTVSVTVCRRKLSTQPNISVAKLSNDGAVKQGEKD
jgi:hypothetical protein